MKYDIVGLKDEEVEKSRAEHGSNELTLQDSETFWEKLIGNFKDPIIMILVVALLINVALAFAGFAEWYEGVAIATAVLLATMVATFSEHKNEASFQKLQEEASEITNKVFRNGQLVEIAVHDIVVGDKVVLQPGDKVPADGRIVQGEMKVNQASLTGESEDVIKRRAFDVQVGDRNDLNNQFFAFRGTVVTDGEAIVEIEQVGDKTIYGRLASELNGEERDSPLKVKLSALAEGISKFGYIGGSFIALSFIFKKVFLDHSFDMVQIAAYVSNWQGFLNDIVTALILAIIIVVVAVPEGLPMMIALVLSLNMRKLLNAKVLVRKMIGIETAGSLNILFTDKTGTLTKGQLETVLFMNGDRQSFPSYKGMPKELQDLLALSVRNNSSCVITTDGQGQRKCIGGNATERAIVAFTDLNYEPSWNVAVEKNIPFNSKRKFSMSQVQGDLNLTLVKGAPETILDRCRFYYDEKGQKKPFDNKKALVQEMDTLAKRAIRLIAVAASEEPIAGEDMPKELTLVGVLGIRDDLRQESVQAVREAQDAGIQVVMITGDRKETATAIAKEVGLLTQKDSLVLTSADLQALSDKELQALLPRLRVVARALPTDKSRLVQIAQSLNMVVGMTGDGVNDAPALSKADVGFAMGSGTEVAKESGDIVILDDNFSSITKAVLYGRTIFNSIRKFLVFQLTVNVAAITVAFLGPFFGVDLPLTMIQLLWVNLVMDTLAALAFGGEPALRQYMQERPKRRDESIINTDMWSSILTNGLSIAAMSIVFLKYPPVQGLFTSEAAFLTGFFAFFIFLNNFNKFNARVEGLNLFSHIGKNTGFINVVLLIFVVQIVFTYIGGDVLRTVGLTFTEWIYVLAFSAIIIPIDLARKAVRNMMSPSEDKSYNTSELSTQTE
ncbi:calcium-translocating P-type ATPase, PMCA-type [Heliorestis acidaminivorans]|uniref:P-type Ca(2+) transporter n=1 Tax=Heliorestis acidaminivorans TaxID=553427 RepID=A0A6I0EYX4_9FIRM|nr:calcium-translocating P-type ATPase, PMCA-type [Heliorestis acidaminivorans]KAB2952602.1 calcium-translocating P-type ATPase, PMCA-type [Heliorestis acidaminivorans]